MKKASKSSKLKTLEYDSKHDNMVKAYSILDNPNGEFDDGIVFCAFRYALGRHTFIVSTVAEYIINNWQFIGKKYRDLIKKEITTYFDDCKRQIERNPGDSHNIHYSIDNPEWNAILLMATHSIEDDKGNIKTKVRVKKFFICATCYEKNSKNCNILTDGEYSWCPNCNIKQKEK